MYLAQYFRSELRAQDVEARQIYSGKSLLTTYALTTFLQCKIGM